MPKRRDEVFRIVSLNVCRLRPTSRRGRVRGERLDQLLSELDADVVALQELEHEGDDRSDGDSPPGRTMHRALGRHSRSGMRGIGVLGRAPFLDASEGRLSARWLDDKGYVRVVVSPPASAGLGPAVEFIALHLDPFSPRARRRQIAALARAVGPASIPRIVAGDLNAMSASALFARKDHDETVAVLADALGVCRGEALKTFPNRFPTLAIDWILLSSDMAFEGLRAVRADFSDHSAIVADVYARA